MIAFGQEHNYGKVPADKILFYKSSNMRDLKNYRIKVTPISSSLTEKIYVHLEPLYLFFVLFGINKCPQFMFLYKHLNGKFERMCPPDTTSRPRAQMFFNVLRQISQRMKNWQIDSSRNKQTNAVNLLFEWDVGEGAWQI